MVKKKLPKKVKVKVDRYIALLIKDGLKFDEVYVFGSHAKGNAHRDSDIDVCVVSDVFTNYIDSINYLNHLKLKDNALLDIEGHGFSSKDFGDKYSFLINEIKTTGIRVL